MLMILLNIVLAALIIAILIYILKSFVPVPDPRIWMALGLLLFILAVVFILRGERIVYNHVPSEQRLAFLESPWETVSRSSVSSLNLNEH